MNDQIFIQHRFKVEENGQSFSDAIVMPQDEYVKLTPEEIETQKQERFNNWQEAIKSPLVQEEISKEEQLAQLEKDIASIEEQKQILVNQKLEVQAEVAEASIKISPVKGGK